MSNEPPEVGRHPSLARLFAPTPAASLVGGEPDPTDMSDRTWWEGQLDRLAEGVFSGPDGPGRAAPLLARWDAQVGRLGAGDVDYTLLQAARVDWALCDAEAPGGGPGESWAWRAAHGCVAGVEPDAAVQALARSQVGLFEVWPGKPAVLRGRIRGLCLRIDDPALAEDALLDRLTETLRDPEFPRERPRDPLDAALPDELARRLQALCVETPVYGTVSSTVMLLGEGRVRRYLYAPESPRRVAFGEVRGGWYAAE